MRQCYECDVCCKIAEVKENDFFKPAGKPCQYLDKGCTIFDQDKRPKMCSSYQCGWLRGFGKENDRPDKSGVMLSISAFNGGTWIFVQELWEDAHKTTGKNIIIDISKKVDIPIIVSDFNTKLGEDYGDYVIIKNSLESRSNKIRGEFLFELEKNIKVYRLIDGNSNV
jgi:hypothetical protein